jgi:hypothetical protein
MNLSHRIDGKPVVLLIGQGEMPVKCAEMLERSGFDIAGVYSPDSPLQNWARQGNNQYCFDDFAAFEAWGRLIEFDYLFSIVNFKIIKPELFRQAKCLAINYHDGPLPRYAGSNAIAWALHNEEPLHGVTWHVIEERVDSGDILKQTVFQIAAGEAHTAVNQKCYLAAMRAFRDLLPELKNGTYVRRPQDLAQRTFFKASMPPPPPLDTLIEKADGNSGVPFCGSHAHRNR